ncbi:MAG: hypothetical protein IJA35_02800 [Clostridia bacterium]|nr:hypothetical protein [Clostridia bacterium]
MNGLLRLFANSKSTGDSRFSGARGVATLTEARDATFSVKHFSSANGKRSFAERTILPIGECRSSPFSSERVLRQPDKFGSICLLQT